jgi:hypothetical protein
MTALFGQAGITRLRKIRRLVDDLGVNLAGVEVILRLVDELAVMRGVESGDDTLPARPASTSERNGYASG